MPIKSRQTSQIEVLFPIVLFLIFTLSALVVILFAARIYQSTIEEGNEQYESNISLSYLTQKVRQGDQYGSVKIDTFDGNECLAITQEIEGTEYTTYIYAYDGYMRELFIANDAKASVSSISGTKLFAAETFQPSLQNEHLLHLQVSYADGAHRHAAVSIRSNESVPIPEPLMEELPSEEVLEESALEELP